MINANCNEKSAMFYNFNYRVSVKHEKIWSPEYFPTLAFSNSNSNFSSLTVSSIRSFGPPLSCNSIVVLFILELWDSQNANFNFSTHHNRLLKSSPSPSMYMEGLENVCREMLFLVHEKIFLGLVPSESQKNKITFKIL